MRTSSTSGSRRAEAPRTPAVQNAIAGRQRVFPLFALCSLLLLSGCATGSHSYYVSPRITGRVLDRDTRQPVSGVQVMRLTGDPGTSADSPPKGGQVMQENVGVRSGPDGTFALASERSVALLQTLGWYSVTVSFTHAAYVRVEAEYTKTNAVLSPQGEPVIRSGDILLSPLPR